MKLQLQSLHWLFGLIETSPFPPSTRCFPNTKKLYFGFTCILKSSLPLPRRAKHYFYWSIYDSLWQHQMSVHVLRHDRPSGRFSKSWGLSASVSLPFLPSPSLLLLLAVFLPYLVPRSLLWNSTDFNSSYAGHKMTGIPCQREGWDRVKESPKLLTILPGHLPLCCYKKNYTAFDFVLLFTGYQFYQKILIKKFACQTENHVHL